MCEKILFTLFLLFICLLGADLKKRKKKERRKRANVDPNSTINVRLDTVEN